MLVIKHIADNKYNFESSILRVSFVGLDLPYVSYELKTCH
jgi:hypothetical protein